ncbi:MAG: hypothetical protein KGJ57_01065 [Sphingomonadales bacterium]|nr:hypothetical protein [Sphingomonadales bacterium]MDE2167999.1 hypothetical protein [Sphingomonadales bacterium]
MKDGLNAHPWVLAALFSTMAAFFVREFVKGWQAGEASARGIPQVFKEANPFFFWLVMTSNGLMAMVCAFGVVMVLSGR